MKDYIVYMHVCPNHILVIDGEGEIEGRKMKKGDSFFVPANNGEYSISGKIEFLVTEI